MYIPAQLQSGGYRWPPVVIDNALGHYSICYAMFLRLEADGMKNLIFEKYIL